MTGTIARIVNDKGFGFIKAIDPAQGAESEYFFHRSGVVGDFEDLREQQTVEFEPTASSKGPRAERVRGV